MILLIMTKQGVQVEKHMENRARQERHCIMSSQVIHIVQMSINGGKAGILFDCFMHDVDYELELGG